MPDRTARWVMSSTTGTQPVSPLVLGKVEARARMPFSWSRQLKFEGYLFTCPAECQRQGTGQRVEPGQEPQGRELVGQSPVALVDLGVHRRVPPAGLHNLANPCGHCPVTVPLPPGVAAGPCPATGTERGRVRPSRSWPVGRLALPDGRSGPEGACRAGRSGGRRTR